MSTPITDTTAIFGALAIITQMNTKRDEGDTSIPTRLTIDLEGATVQQVMNTLASSSSPKVLVQARFRGKNAVSIPDEYTLKVKDIGARSPVVQKSMADMLRDTIDNPDSDDMDRKLAFIHLRVLNNKATEQDKSFLAMLEDLDTPETDEESTEEV